MTLRTAVLAGIVIALIVVACGSGGSEIESSPTYSMSGIFRLIDGTWRAGEPCFGTGGYYDITPLAPVVVRNQDGTVLATTELGQGRSALFPDARPPFTVCEFRFGFTSLPEEEFYSVTVSQRGELVQSLDELEASSWLVEIVLGDPAFP